MDETLTEIEQKVIGILTQHEQSPDAYGGPIHEIERAMGWTTLRTNEFVDGLIHRKLVHPESIVRGGGRYRPAWIWKKGEP
jgi:hypothetical protein